MLSTVGKPMADLLGLEVAGQAFAQDAPDFVDYHAVTSAFHRQQTEKLPALGFRLVSLSIYDLRFVGRFDFRFEPRYAAVWLRQSGPAQRFVQDVNSAGFQSAFDDLTQAGFKPTIIAATTLIFGNHRFAAVFEETSEPIPLTRHGLVSGGPDDPGTIEYWTQQARRGGKPPNEPHLPTDRWRPTTLTVYGSAQQPLFAGVWEPNPEAIAWNTDGLTETFEDYQRRFDAQVTAWNRPAYVTVSPFVRYLSLFQDDQIDPWIARHGMDRADYERQREEFVSQGFFPLVVQAGGFGSSVRYAALFAKRDRPIRRRFTLRDSEDLQRNDIDDVMENMMVANGIRQAALAVVHRRRLLFARGYTSAERDYPFATATTYFRVGSLSKVLTALMVMRLVQEGRLRLEDRIQDLLNLKTPSDRDPADPLFNEVTIQQALTRFSGLRGSWHDGPEVRDAFRREGVDAHLPVTPLQIARYEVGQPDPADPLMIGKPGESHPNNFLSNFGYLLVSLVVERIAGPNGESFAQIVRDGVGGPLAAMRIRNAMSLVSEQEPDEARYHYEALGLDLSVMSNDRPLVPLQYGGGGHNFRPMAAPGGFSATVVDFVRLLAALNVRRNNPLLNSDSIDTMLRKFIGWDYPHGCNPEPDGKCTGVPPNAHRVKGGSLASAQAVANFTQGELAYVVFWARSDVRGIDDKNGRTWYAEFPDLTRAIDATFDPVLRHTFRDRFPDFGMPSF